MTHPAGGHEGGAGHVRLNMPLRHHEFESLAEVGVAHNVEPVDHVNHADNVEDSAEKV